MKRTDVDTLMIQMQKCGHSEEFRGLVATRVVARYFRSLSNHVEGVRRMYRSKKERLEQVKEAGGKATKSNWFKK